MGQEPEQLYDGDKRVDAFVDDVENKIYELCGGRLTVVTVIGILERVKWRFMREQE